MILQILFQYADANFVLKKHHFLLLKTVVLHIIFVEIGFFE